MFYYHVGSDQGNCNCHFPCSDRSDVFHLLQLELPTFKELSKHYLGYKHKGTGHDHGYSNLEIFAIIGKAPLPAEHKEDTTALRMSLAFNRLGGYHRLGTDEIHISKNHEHDSVQGRDGQQYIYRTTAYGPFLAMKYKSPQLIRIDPLDPKKPERTITGRQGIVRFVTFHNKNKHADARIALWNCDHLHDIRELSKMHHLISVEFWELPGKYIYNNYSHITFNNDALPK